MEEFLHSLSTLILVLSLSLCLFSHNVISFNRGKRGALWCGWWADITDGSQTPPHTGLGTYARAEIWFEWGGAKTESRPAGTNPSQWFPYTVLSAAINWSHFRQAWITYLPLLLALGQGDERFPQDFPTWFYCSENPKWFPSSSISIEREAQLYAVLQVTHKLCHWREGSWVSRYTQINPYTSSLQASATSKSPGGPVKADCSSHPQRFWFVCFFNKFPGNEKQPNLRPHFEHYCPGPWTSVERELAFYLCMLST